ncbi:MAG: sortase [Oscillospiraceae bacterium]|nr:sortase [Oscillospiraceae bacterium]
MRGKKGIVLILAGLVLIAAAFVLHRRNTAEGEEAAAFVQEMIPQIVGAIDERQKAPEAALPQFIIDQGPDPNRPMPTETIGGHDYIGMLCIPSLELELPIMSAWSYPKLRMAPCRYTGSLYLDDLVLMAHNYDRHFGRIKDLRPGDSVLFTDMDGETVKFEVVATEILHSAAVEEMTAGDFDLTLFTCTYGGKSRVTLRCDRVEVNPYE